jgi:DNA helicase II / ATP-dependent DNA helicase PcrA
MEVEININTPIRQHLSPDELWRQDDKGLIQAWELGRMWAKKHPKISRQASMGQLMPLLFQGGYSKRLECPFQYGSLHYYAMWTGLRMEDLSLNIDKEYPLVCSKTKMGVVYTINSKKYLSSGISKSKSKVYGDRFLVDVLSKNVED